eukprot:2690082-Rhodomonas_salina.2
MQRRRGEAGEKPIEFQANPERKVEDVGLGQLRREGANGRQDGATPLYVAVKQGHMEVVDRLIAARCNVQARQVGEPRSVRAVPQTSWDARYWRRFLHTRVESGREKMFWITEMRGGPSVWFQCGATPLHIAAEKERVEVVDRLIAASCNVLAGTPEVRAPRRAFDMFHNP